MLDQLGIGGPTIAWFQGPGSWNLCRTNPQVRFGKRESFRCPRHTSSVTAIGAMALLKLSPEVQISMSCPSEYVGTPSAKTAKICCVRDGVHVFGGLAWVWAVWPVQLVIFRFNWPRRQIRFVGKAMFRSLVTPFLIIMDPNGSVPTTSKSECKRSHKPILCVCVYLERLSGIGILPSSHGGTRTPLRQFDLPYGCFSK